MEVRSQGPTLKVVLIQAMLLHRISMVSQHPMVCHHSMDLLPNPMASLGLVNLVIYLIKVQPSHMVKMQCLNKHTRTRRACRCSSSSSKFIIHMVLHLLLMGIISLWQPQDLPPCIPSKVASLFQVMVSRGVLVLLKWFRDHTHLHNQVTLNNRLKTM